MPRHCALHEGTDGASVEVGEAARQEFIETHLDGEDEFPLVPVPFGRPPVVVPTELQLGNPAVDVQQIFSLLEGIHRPRLGFMTVTDSHTA